MANSLSKMANHSRMKRETGSRTMLYELRSVQRGAMDLTKRR